jgi:hypothetical protein
VDVRVGWGGGGPAALCGQGYVSPHFMEALHALLTAAELLWLRRLCAVGCCSWSYGGSGEQVQHRQAVKSEPQSNPQ